MNAATVFQDTYARSAQTVPLPTLLDDIAAGRPEKERKDGCPLFSTFTFGEQRTDKESLRSDDNAIAASAVVGDYDQGKISPELGRDILSDVGICAVIATTGSHTKEKPRWRCICPTSRALTKGEYPNMVARLNGLFDGNLAQESFTVSQSYYFGRVNGHDFISYRTDGRCIDELDELDDGAVFKKTSTDKTADDPTPDSELRETIRTGDDGVQRALLALAARWTGRGMEPSDIAATLTALLDECSWKTVDPKRWERRRRSIARCVATAQAKFGDWREKKDVPNVWALPQEIGAQEWAEARLTPDCVVENYLYADVGVIVSPGGMGKSTLMLYEAIHIALGLPLYDLRVFNPGPVLLVTAEDTREMLVGRMRRIAESLTLRPEQIAQVRRDVRILDVNGLGAKLTIVHENVVLPAPGIDNLIDAHLAFAPRLVVIDPAVSFGVGESRINDAEQGLVEAARRIRTGLNCCVRYVHHVGKTNAREKTLDQYTSRGGSALPDGARMVTVMQPLSNDEWREAAGWELEEGANGLILVRAKTSYARLQKDILISRNDFGFFYEERANKSKAQRVQDAAADLGIKIMESVVSELAQNRRYSKTALADLAMVGSTRQLRRSAISQLMAAGLLHEEPDNRTGKGGAQTYLRPIDGWKPPPPPTRGGKF